MRLQRKPVKFTSGVQYAIVYIQSACQPFLFIYIRSNVEFHPVLFNQHKKSPYKELPSFNEAVDEFFSNLESQKIESKIHQKVCEVEYCS